MEEFLERHGIPPETIQTFEINGITLELFFSLTENQLKELCPHMGTRIKLSQLITENAPTETNSSVSAVSVEKAPEDVSETTSHNIDALENVDYVVTRAFPDFDLKTLLQITAGGNHIVNFYKTFGILDSSRRNQLTDIIIKHLYNYAVQYRLCHEDYNIIAAKIVTLFPKENAGTYFINPIKKGQSPTGKPVVAKGKLVDKARNLLYKFKGSKRPSTSQTESDLHAKKPRIETTETSNEDKDWLKENSEPWDEVLQRWKKTSHLRQDGTTYVNIHDLFIHWPILNDVRSEQLINLDFDKIYPDKGLKFYMNWTEFFKKLISSKQPKDENILSILNAIEELDDDLKIPGQIKTLVHLIPPKGRLTKNVKFSTQEALDTIFITCPNPGDIDNTIEEQKQKAKARKLPLQPFIILQGTIYEPSSPLLVIDNIKYQFNNISKAFDTLFKAFHAFHAEYPRASGHIHLIIQRCVYKITTKYDNVVPSIVDVLNL